MTRWVNRSAFLVRFREPYLAWAASIDSQASEHIRSYTNNVSVYLVSEDPGGKQEAAPLRNYYEEIFRRELEAWCPDESRWPQDRTLRLFKEWFQVDVQGIVTDLEDTPLEVEEL